MFFTPKTQNSGPELHNSKGFPLLSPAGTVEHHPLLELSNKQTANNKQGVDAAPDIMSK